MVQLKQNRNSIKSSKLSPLQSFGEACDSHRTDGPHRMNHLQCRNWESAFPETASCAQGVWVLKGLVFVVEYWPNSIKRWVINYVKYWEHEICSNSGPGRRQLHDFQLLQLPTVLPRKQLAPVERKFEWIFRVFIQSFSYSTGSKVKLSEWRVPFGALRKLAGREILFYAIGSSFQFADVNTVYVGRLNFDAYWKRTEAYCSAMHFLPGWFDWESAK